MRKIIVTHTGPDLDAACAVWLIRRFWDGWESAEVCFVPANETLKSWMQKTGRDYEASYGNSEVVHVDTGLGEFDHHQDNRDTSAAVLVFNKVKEDLQYKGKLSKKDELAIEVLERLTSEVNNIDHFRNLYYGDPTSDYHEFSLEHIMDGLQLVYNEKGNGDLLVIEQASICLDGVYKAFKERIRAEAEIEDAKNTAFDSIYGKSIAFASANDTLTKVAQRYGYQLVIRKNPKKGHVTIKAVPEKGIDLTTLYKKLVLLDSNATWYLHPSKTMLLNGSSKNPTMRATKLTLEEVVEVVKKCS